MKKIFIVQKQLLIILCAMLFFCGAKSQECIHIDWAGFYNCSYLIDKASFYERLKNTGKNCKKIDIFEKDTINLIIDYLTKREEAGERAIGPEMIVYVHNEDNSITEYEVSHNFFRIVGEKMVYRLPIEMIEIMVNLFPNSFYKEKLYYFNNNKRIRHRYFKGQKGYWYVKM